MSTDLEVANVTVRFGGIVAVDDVSLSARAGQITGLIGPNGAGKTTFFNACTGRNRPRSGTVRLGGHDLHALRTSRRAHHGLGRTFQRMELFESLTVRENVVCGPAAHLSGSRPLGLIHSTRRETRQINGWAEQALGRCGIADLANRVVGDLSTGQRRLVELARAIATPFRFLLLDEPSSGLDVSETQAFGAVLSDWVAETGHGILLVEHDMALVSEICQQIYVLDFGKVIYRGTTREALSSDLVKAAYLGEASVV